MPRHNDDVYDRDQRSSAQRESRDRDPRDPRSSGRAHDRVAPARDIAGRRIIEDRMDYRDQDAMDIQMDPRIGGIVGGRIDPRSDGRPDPRSDPRSDPRANAGARIDRTDRGMDRHNSRQTEVLYKDPRTGEIFRENPYERSYAHEDPDDMITSRRPIIDLNPPRDRDDPTPPKYNDYFVPGEGIDREVIQHEICRYLGQDATCRPYRNQDGRQGYLVRAYRPFTTPMIKSLIDDTRRWRIERDKRARQGRAQGSYAEMRDRQDRHYETMDMDDYDAPPQSRHREPDPRTVISNRHTSTVATTSYAAEPGYPGYSLTSTQAGNYGPETQPRTAYAGNTTPPTIGRTNQAPYGQTGYTSRTSAATATAAPLMGNTYTDPRTGETVRLPPQGYPSDTGRHARR